MTPRTTLPAAAQVVGRPLSTGNLLADCERWCRDRLPHRGIPGPARGTADALAPRGALVRTGPAGR